MEALEVRDEVVGRAHRQALRHVDELDQDVGAELLGDARVEHDQLGAVLHDHVAGVQVGVDEAVLEAHLEHHVAHRLGERRVMAVGDLLDLLAAHELHREHAHRRQLGVDPGNRTAVVPAKFFAEALVVLGLEAEIGLIVDRLDEVARVADRIGQSRLRRDRDQARAGEQDHRVALDLAPDAGRSTLTATSVPSARCARWTCATLAAAIGRGSKSRKISASGRPRSFSTCAVHARTRTAAACPGACAAAR